MTPDTISIDEMVAPYLTPDDATGQPRKNFTCRIRHRAEGQLKKWGFRDDELVAFRQEAARNAAEYFDSVNSH